MLQRPGQCAPAKISGMSWPWVHCLFWIDKFSACPCQPQKQTVLFSNFSTSWDVGSISRPPSLIRWAFLSALSRNSSTLKIQGVGDFQPQGNSSDTASFCLFVDIGGSWFDVCLLVSCVSWRDSWSVSWDRVLSGEWVVSSVGKCLFFRELPTFGEVLN